jgi:hypothetical protein
MPHKKGGHVAKDCHHTRSASYNLCSGAPFAPETRASNWDECDSADIPQFSFGFAELQAQIGPAMGYPVTCEFRDPNGTGDVLQVTSKGLAFVRNKTNLPSFTDGYSRWALTSAGLVNWTGSSIDPPPGALYFAPPGLR